MKTFLTRRIPLFLGVTILLFGIFLQTAHAAGYVFLDKWADAGSGDGEVNNPMGITLDQGGDFYIADTFNHRIQKFDSSGNFILKWGSFGSGDGQFNLPYSIAIDHNGNIYVADVVNNRIQKFDSSGNFIAKWGSPGSGDGEFNNPYAVAVDGSGNVYVSDSNNSRIQKFDSSGAYLSQFGTNGSGDGQFTSPAGIAFDQSGNIYVVDRDSNNRISKFDSSGAFLLSWGGTGSGDGEFDGPYGIAIDENGNVIVADTNNNRVEKFDSVGTYLTQWGIIGTGDGQFVNPTGVTVDQTGNVYIVDSSNRRIQKFAYSDLPIVSTTAPTVLGNSSVQLSATITDTGTATDTDRGFEYGTTTSYGTTLSESGSFSAGSFSLTASNLTSTVYHYRVFVTNENGQTAYGEDQTFVNYGYYKWGSYGNGDGEFYFLTGIAIDQDGYVYVADTANNRIQKFDSAGNFIAKWGSFGSGDGQFNSPTGITIDNAGNIYVADTGNDRIQKFDPSGNFIAKFGNSGNNDGEFTIPTDIAVDINGNMYIADASNQRIQKFDSSGNFILKWGSYGTTDGNFKFPLSLTLDHDGNVYVTDRDNYRVQKFDSSGNFIAKWGTNGSGNGEFYAPIFVRSDQNSNIYVVDRDIFRIQKFDSSGNFIAKWGSDGSDDGKFSYPQGIATDQNGNIYVSDGGNSRIQKFITAVAVQNLGPVNRVDGSISVPQPTLSFDLVDPHADETVKYRIQIDDTSDFSSPVVDYTSALISHGTATFRVGQAESGGTYTTGSQGQALTTGNYYWRVKAITNTMVESSYISARFNGIAFVVDASALAISAIQATPSGSGTRATISWTTNRNSTSSVQYGTTASYGSNESNSSLVTNHTISLSSLAPSTTYHYMISSVEDGVTTSSSDHTFATNAAHVSTITRIMGASEPDSSSCCGDISSDGRFSGFYSNATNLVADDTNNQADNFVYDRVSESIERVSVATDGTEGNGRAGDISISNDGKYVVFDSYSTNLFPGGTTGESNIYIRDRQLNTTTLITKGGGGQGGDSDSFLWGKSISADGRYVVFYSGASNLVPDDTNNQRDVFVYDQTTDKITRIMPANTEPDGASYDPSISADGRYVVFYSDASNLVPDDTNGQYDIFVYDQITQAITRIAPTNAEPNAYSDDPVISANGRYIAFYSGASNLVPDDNNNQTDIFVYDRDANSYNLVSSALDGTASDGPSYSPSISADGRYVAFYSDATNLVSDDTNNASDIFVYDNQTGKNKMISISVDGDSADGGSYSYYGGISADGKWLLFESYATNLVEDDSNGPEEMFLASLEEPSSPTVTPTKHHNRSSGGSGRSAPAVVQATMPQNVVPSCGPMDHIDHATGIPCHQSTTTVPTVSTFASPQSLKFGTNTSDVKLLQQLLNKLGFTVSATGFGSPGLETNYFGTKTRLAVIKFQKAYGITPSIGIFGPKTRAAIIQLTK